MLEIPVEEFVGVSTGVLEFYEDSRGNFKKFTLESSGTESSILPITFASSMNYQSGVVRGLHYQLKPFEEAKFITCSSGSIFDVIVDLRSESKTFQNWACFTISEVSNNFLSIPKGFAHGYQVLENQTRVSYSIFGQYAPSHSRRISIFDKKLDIKWPLPITDISKFDFMGISLADALKEIL